MNNGHKEADRPAAFYRCVDHGPAHFPVMVLFPGEGLIRFGGLEVPVEVAERVRDALIDGIVIAKGVAE